MTVLELIGLIAILWVIYDFIITPNKIDFIVKINEKTIIDYIHTLPYDTFIYNITTNGKLLDKEKIII